MKSQTDALKGKEEFEQTILINSDTVKQLDKEIKNLVKDKIKKESSKKEK